MAGDGDSLVDADSGTRRALIQGPIDGHRRAGDAHGLVDGDTGRVVDAGGRSRHWRTRGRYRESGDVHIALGCPTAVGGESDRGALQDDAGVHVQGGSVVATLAAGAFGRGHDGSAAAAAAAGDIDV